MARTYNIGGYDVRLVTTAVTKKHYEWECPRCQGKMTSDRRPISASFLVCNECRLKEAQERERDAMDRWMEENPEVKGAEIVDIDNLGIDGPQTLILRAKSGRCIIVEIDRDWDGDSWLEFKVVSKGMAPCLVQGES